jgi:ABC transporter substrate binding protein
MVCKPRKIQQVLARYGPSRRLSPRHLAAGAAPSGVPSYVRWEIDAYFSRAAVLADNIINGAKPDELPIEQPDHFQLIINIKTAKALRITIHELIA